MKIEGASQKNARMVAGLLEAHKMGKYVVKMRYQSALPCVRIKHSDELSFCYSKIRCHPLSLLPQPTCRKRSSHLP